jgi:hypothetical protein
MAEQYLPASAMLFCGDLRAEKGKHRAFDAVYDILLAAMTINRATHAATGIEGDWAPGAWTAVESRVFPQLNLALPTYNTLERVISGIEATQLRLMVVIFLYDYTFSLKTSAFLRLVNRIGSAHFVQFIDPWLDWVRANLTTDYHNWPPLCNFGRVIRNAATHGGTINIESKTAPSVRWYSLQYDHRSRGRAIFGSDISCADLILLMFEVSDELDKLGAPLTPP